MTPSLAAFIRLRYSAGGHPLTAALSQRAGALLGWLAWKLGCTPNQVTLFAGAVSLAGAGAFALTSGRGGLCLTLGLVQLGYALDCADGQLARAARRTSALGRWLDVFLDMLTITSLAFASLYRILRFAPELLPQATFATMLYCFSRTSNLFTSTLARSGPLRAEEQKSLPRLLYLGVIDTTTVLVCIPLLGNQPRLLCAYLAGIGALFVIHSIYVGIAYNRPSTQAA